MPDVRNAAHIQLKTQVLLNDPDGLVSFSSSGKSIVLVEFHFFYELSYARKVAFEQREMW